jgi:hypothetical protein
MLRTTITPALTLVAALAFAACGSGDDGAGASVMPERAKASVERAAHVALSVQEVPAEARDQGLEASYTNAATAAKDKQAVGLFVMEDAGVADKVSDMVRGSAPEQARLIVKGNVMVVYATTGKDRAAAVENAVEAL